MGTSDKSCLEASLLAKRYTGPVYEQQGELNGNFLAKLCLAFQVKMNEAPMLNAEASARTGLATH